MKHEMESVTNKLINEMNRLFASLAPVVPGESAPPCRPNSPPPPPMLDWTGDSPAVSQSPIVAPPAQGSSESGTIVPIIYRVGNDHFQLARHPNHVYPVQKYLDALNRLRKNERSPKCLVLSMLRHFCTPEYLSDHKAGGSRGPPGLEREKRIPLEFRQALELQATQQFPGQPVDSVKLTKAINSLCRETRKCVVENVVID